jgi:glycosyltransferase involved in cell wall biosynthesis
VNGVAPSFPLHRTGTFPRVTSLKSGPSLGKVLLDARMAVELRALEKKLAPEVIVAHHVEAAAQALLVAKAPVVFFAHTDLNAELPAYAPGAPQLMAAGLARAGGALDGWLAKRAGAVALISKSLRAPFAAQLGVASDKLFYVPTPWRVAQPFAANERAESRHSLGLAPDSQVLLYAGNLDRYQGIELLLAAVSMLKATHERLVCLFATESDARELRAQAAALGLSGRLFVTRLAGAAARRLAHAAADVAVVPRLCPGGLPIKLLDALARGVPCATLPRACAGLPLDASVELAENDEPAALARAIDTLLRSPERRAELASAGPRYIAEQHAAPHFFAGLDAAIACARGRR